MDITEEQGTEMRRAKLTAIAFAAAMAVAGATTGAARAQDATQPSIDLPDPFGAATSFGQLPVGRDDRGGDGSRRQERLGFRALWR